MMKSLGRNFMLGVGVSTWSGVGPSEQKRCWRVVTAGCLVTSKQVFGKRASRKDLDISSLLKCVLWRLNAETLNAERSMLNAWPNGKCWKRIFAKHLSKIYTSLNPSERFLLTCIYVFYLRLYISLLRHH